MRGWLATSSPCVVRLEEDSVVPLEGEGEEEEEEHRNTAVEQGHGVVQGGQHWEREERPLSTQLPHLSHHPHPSPLTSVAKEGDVDIVEEPSRPEGIGEEAADEVGTRQH